VGIFSRSTKPADLDVTPELVRDLLRDQHPDLADRPVTAGPRGWANQMWRLGDDLVVRMPWMGDTADTLLMKEHTWLPQLAPHLPLPVPVPQRLGHPSTRFPHPWIVTTWLDGQPADAAPVTQGDSAADSLAAFLTALHQPAPAAAPKGHQGRGGPLGQAASVARLFRATTKLCAAAAGTGEELPDPDAVRAIWDDALEAPAWDGPPTWLHGDLHPANVLTTPDGALSGVIDFGDLCAGDPALDLAAGWILLPDQPAIERFRAAYRAPADDATWRRARGWAVWRAFGCLGIATAGPPGGKPRWGPPAVASLDRLTASC
jgi:aminoglycoside phosphotransferase (APT) family kinase protein